MRDLESKRGTRMFTTRCQYVPEFLDRIELLWLKIGREFLARIVVSLRGEQWRTEVRCRPGQAASLATPCSNLRYFRSKCTQWRSQPKILGEQNV